MTLHLPTFFDYARKAPFGGRLTQSQVDGLNRIMAAWERRGDGDDRKLAYVLATAFHETGGRMQPVREGFAKTDAGARRIVASRRYGKPDPVTGHVYYGRGDVQLTWPGNYERVGEALGLPLREDPDLALDPATSADILVQGMMRALYTPGHGLPRYFGADDSDPIGARRIVNGTDKSRLIAGYYRNFLDSLQAARAAAKLPSHRAPLEAGDADGADLKTDPVAIGGVLAGVGGVAGAASMIKPILEGVTSPWAVVALGMVLLAAWLVVSGRVKLKREGGV